MSDQVTRREAIRMTARWVVLSAGMAALGAMAARRGTACDRSGLCRGCPALSGCDLPAARQARRPKGIK